MLDCKCLIHPFQNDPGTSQSQRIMDELLDNAPKIDGRTLADLLNYFVELSSQINYYDASLNISDWQPFFKKSIPFTLAGIICYKTDTIKLNFTGYNNLFEKRPSVTGLQLNAYFIYYRFIHIINSWHLSVKDSDLPLTQRMENVIRNTLQQPVKLFMSYANAAAQTFGMSRIDFTSLTGNAVWGFDPNVTIPADTGFSQGTSSKYKQIMNLFNQFKSLLPVFTEAIRLLSLESEKNLQQSLLPLKAELQEKHPPHLGLLFAFLSVFQELQKDLNRYTRKHLDYFYSSILQFKSAGAVPDKAHIIFEIQKQLKTYLIKKGIRVKDGKDENKQEILFALDDEIVVNKTTVKDTRTLFLNNLEIPDAIHPGQDIALVEGVYMAPDASKADGIDKEFQTDIKNFYSVGNRESKYLIPGTQTYKPYPNARLGFILASPVLLLNEGRRTINITIACRLEDPTDIRDDLICDSGDNPNAYPELYSTKALFTKVKKEFRKKYIYISEDLIQQAVKKGISDFTAALLRDTFLLEESKMVCNKPENKYLLEDAVEWSDWWNKFYANYTHPAYKYVNEKDVLDTLFTVRRVFKLLFSGEKEWIEPTQIKRMRLTPMTEDAGGKKTFAIKCKAILDPTKGAVTFFDKEKLKEDYNTTSPVVKIVLDDKIKIKRGFPVPAQSCCLQRPADPGKLPLSFYYFFRNAKIIDKTDADLFTASFNTNIAVKVCGLKKFVVQNDESIMDVNGPIYPFSARPDIIDFNIINPSFCITPAFVNDAVNFLPGPGISNNAKNALMGLLSPANGNKVRISIAARNSFLNQTFPGPVTLTPAEKTILNHLIDDPTKNYCNEILRGPSFYVGSKEVFCKKWNDVFINFNWKDKPADFRDYYKGYIAKPDPADPTKYIYGLDKNGFQINVAVLDDGIWHGENPIAAPPADTTVHNTTTGDENRLLFPDTPMASFCTPLNPFQQNIHINNLQFNALVPQFEIDALPITKFESTSRKGFLRINLQNQDFLHNDYAYVLARQMNAAAALTLLDKDNKPNPQKIEDAVYYDSNGNLIVFSAAGIRDDVAKSVTISTSVEDDINNGATGIAFNTVAAGYGTPIATGNADNIRDILNPPVFLHMARKRLMQDAIDLKNLISGIQTTINQSGANFQAIIPNEPWTPIINGISIDYTATAAITDMDLIHLYPYDGTYKSEEIVLTPALLPTFCDEGTLFIGLENLVPGSNLNILFQLAEATADSELPKEDVRWHYLGNNEWQPLRSGFEVLDDSTKNLTTSGIIKYALPETMTNDNTVMPKSLHWIKAAIAKNSRAVSETTAILAQAMLAIFTNDAANDKLRLSIPLPANSIAKLNEADAAVKTISQPFDSFDGAVPEAEKQFYVRVSETLRHKGRAIQAFDYERIALQAFPKLFKSKCINHSLQLNANEFINDFPFAPGYVTLAVIPDLNKLKPGNSFEPKVPVSMLEEIDEYVRKRISPFVRFRSVNPRYERIQFSIRVQLLKGKDDAYYREKLKEDVRELLAPWAIGKYDKLTFGQCVYRSDIIRLLETSDYVDFISELKMARAGDVPAEHIKICPGSPRSILVAGDVDVCIDVIGCETWGQYSPCQKQIIGSCNNPPEPIARYCREVKKKPGSLYGG